MVMMMVVMMVAPRILTHVLSFIQCERAMVLLRARLLRNSSPTQNAVVAETLPEADSEGFQRGHRARAGGELSARQHAHPRGAAQALGRQDVARSASRVVLVHD